MNIYDEALELLNNGCDGPQAFDTYKIALERAKKEYKLLELYQTRDGLGLTESDLYAELTQKITKLEKELKL